MTTRCSSPWGVGSKEEQTLALAASPLWEKWVMSSTRRVLDVQNLWHLEPQNLLLSRILALTHLVFSSAANMRVGLPELWRQYCDLWHPAMMLLTKNSGKRKRRPLAQRRLQMNTSQSQLSNCKSFAFFPYLRYLLNVQNISQCSI